ncbi:MAG: acyltransferase [Moraxellaceae bacterium]|nr:MAG: acyltransferase [Moraxellaceae bacterium]
MHNSNVTTPPTRFYALDGVRGIAAIAVMFYHYTQHNGLNWLHSAWVAVDIFFVLSGFVLMHSYSKKVAQGMTFKEFMYSRIARLGPMYVVGLALGICAAALAMFSNSQSPLQPNGIATAAVLNFFLLPYFNGYSWPFGSHNIHGTVFPLNDPAWSLFFEMFVNIVFFAYLSRFLKINLPLFVAIGGIIFVALTLYFHQINPGARGVDFIFGFPRVIFEFFLGVLIYGFYNRYKPQPTIVVYGLFALVGLLFFSSKGAVALVNALILAPLLIALLAKVAVTRSAAHVCKFLGDISYPLYVTHFPIYRLLYESPFMQKLPPVAQTFLFAAIALLVAIVLVKIDESVRSTLKNRRSMALQNN